MIKAMNAYDHSLPWRSDAYHLSARYKVLESGQSAEGPVLYYVEIEAGGRILPHARADSESYFCIEGRGTFLCEEEHTPLTPGDCFVVPSNQVRAITNSNGGTLRLLLVRGDRQSSGPIDRLRALLG